MRTQSIRVSVGNCALVILASLTHAFASVSDAQVTRTSSALALLSVTHEGKEWRYQYRVVGMTRPGETITDVFVDVRSPKDTTVPVITGMRGQFLFDAIAKHFSELDYSHPPLFIGTPARWSGAVYKQGAVSWGASRSANAAHDGVASRTAVDGFELRSAAVPALRRFSVVPYRPLGPPTVSDVVPPTDTTFVILTGLVPAPGWSVAQVTGAFLLEQVEAACAEHMLENCGRYLRLTDVVRASEGAMNDRSYLEAVHQVGAMLASDHVSHQHARFVLTEVVRALEDRLPSHRAPAR